MKITSCPKDISLNEKLLRILQMKYFQVSQNEGFPAGHCQQVSKKLKELGLRLESGYFLVDQAKDNLRLRPHVWVTGAERNSGFHRSLV